jgi:RNA polymerase-associated protein RTF1
MDTGSDEDEGSPPPRSHDRSREKPDLKKEERKMTKEDLSRIQLTRTQLAKECMKPWFEDYIKG